MQYNTLSVSQSLDSFVSDSASASSSTSGYCSSSIRDLSDLDEDVQGHNSFVFESTRPLLHSLEYILCVQEMCDVTFLVGKTKEPIHGLRAVMAARSRYFRELFAAHAKKKTDPKSNPFAFISSVFGRKTSMAAEVPAPSRVAETGDNNRVIITIYDYDHDVFRRVLSYVHLGQVTVTSDVVIGLICASIDYDLEDLRKACWDFVDRCLAVGDTEALLRTQSKYRKRKELKPFFKMISKMNH